ncbi:regulatory protein RecX [Microbacterium sp.]|uniref:regulatory protein RecX n=1 Tax=Microbacterium sp. TaxID=51671 RepID=UPI003F9D4010
MSDGGEDRLAPVIPLFGGRMTRASELRPDAEKPAPKRSVGDHAHALGRTVDQAGRPAEPAGQTEPAGQAEEALVRKLRARSLSVSEARQVLRGHDLDAAGIDDVIDKFCERGYLDDALLAEHLVISGVERKGQGRVALSRALAQRGIPRDVIDTALGDLPDDDAERALEFARTKARSMARLDADTALRRLLGQLARRGYGGSVATSAARAALAEASLGAPTTGVRFVESD